jgi:hypothetical protein
MTANSVGVQPLQSTNVGGTIGNAQSGIGGLSSTYGSLGSDVLPQAQQTASNLYNNPYAQTAQSGANTASGMGTTAATNTFGAGAAQIPYANQIFQTAFDPQQALYNQQYALNQNQANVQNAQAGVANTPYGAGVTNQADQNFNLNWQNQQLGRETQGAQSAGALTQQALGEQSAGANQYVQAATVPYSTYTDIGSGQNSALSQLLGIGSSGANLSNLPVQDYLSLLTGQNQTNQVANQTSQVGLQQNQQNWNQLASLGSGLGTAAGYLWG